MLSSFSKRPGLWLLLAVAGCGLKCQEAPRPKLDPVLLELPPNWRAQERSEQEFLQELYPAESACSVLASYKSDLKSPGNTLLMLDNVQVGGRPLERPGDRLGDVRERDPRPLDIARVNGRVDVAYNPLFQLGLLLQEIPDRKKFLELIDEEISNSFFRIIPLIAWKALITSPFGDVYKERNKLLEDKISEALPGSFDRRGDRVFLLEEALPNVVLQNGIPTVGMLGPTFDDTKESRIEKNLNLEGILRAYSTPVDLIVSEEWSEVFRLDRLALASSVSAFLRNDPLEQACATVLLHRSFAQMLAVIGMDRLPVKPTSKDPKRYAFPEIAQLLNGKDSSEFMVCPTSGVFAKDESYIRVSVDFLGSYTKEGPPLDLSRQAKRPELCTPQTAIPFAQAQDSLWPPRRQAIEDLARAEDWLDVLGGFVNFAVAINPGSAWWRSSQNVLGYPLVAFDDINRAKGLGGILPVDAHVLALGLLNLGVPNFLNKHMVYLNSENRFRDMSDSDVIKIRISEDAFDRTKLAPKQVRTTIRSAARLAEMAFKLSNSLWRLDDWLVTARASLADEISRSEKGLSSRTVESILKEYQDFVEGLFGSEENLLLLVATGDNSIRADLERLKEASAMLMAAFENPQGVCFASLDLDLSTAVEQGVGECNPAERKEWNYSLSLIADRYQSALFERLRIRSL
jgi:hypothetical protein